MPLDRRNWLTTVGAGIGAAWGLGPAVARALAEARAERHCIILWMPGGPSQLDTFDPKPEHANGGEFAAIETSVPGVRFCEHLPQLARWAGRMAVVRSMSSIEGDHGRATFHVRTGYRPTGPLRYPPVAAALAKELRTESDGLPAYVSIAPYEAFNRAAFGAGFLGPRNAPLTVAAGAQAAPPPGEFAALEVDDLAPPSGVDRQSAERRRALWGLFEDRFLARHPLPAPQAHATTVRRAWQMLDGSAAEAFDLSREADDVRRAYGMGRFGQGCLLARRLVERGVSCVEVTLGSFADGQIGWDTHAGNFPAVRALCGELDSGWSRLMAELDERGLLDRTTILWAGEFGRTPVINPQAGRDHFPGGWSTVLAGGGIRGGQAYGRTSADGMQVEADKASVADLLATLSAALGVDPARENLSNLGRPIKLTEGTPIAPLLA